MLNLFKNNCTAIYSSYFIYIYFNVNSVILFLPMGTTCPSIENIFTQQILIWLKTLRGSEAGLWWALMQEGKMGLREGRGLCPRVPSAGWGWIQARSLAAVFILPNPYLVVSSSGMEIWNFYYFSFLIVSANVMSPL